MALADDEEKYLPEKYLQMKESVERYTALHRNVVLLLHIMLLDLNIKKSHPSTILSSNLSIWTPINQHGHGEEW